MRRALVVLLAGFTLAFAVGAIGAGAQVITVGTTVLTTESPTYTDSKGLQPLPSGARAEPDSRLPHSDKAAYVLLALVALTVLVALVLFLFSRLLAIEPRWVTDGRHSFAEAGWHVSNTWAEFKDWLRLGR
jgi:hypothetical protein